MRECPGLTARHLRDWYSALREGCSPQNRSPLPEVQSRVSCQNRRDLCLKLTNHMHSVTIKVSWEKLTNVSPPPLSSNRYSLMPTICFSNPELEWLECQRKNTLIVFSNGNKMTIHFPFSLPFLFHTHVHPFKLDSFMEYTVERMSVIPFFVATLYI